jgi:TusA-related sulfurtransferase
VAEHPSCRRPSAEPARPGDPIPPAVPAVGAEFIAALASRNPERLERCFHSKARLRALVPSGPQEHQGSGTIAARFTEWFRQADSLEILDQEADTVSDRLHLRYRFREDYGDGDTEVIEQDAFCELKDQKILAMDLVCSGHRPGQRRPETEVRQYDAGELGCGSGLPQAFRQEIGTVPVGAILEVRTRDPSAIEDLPALARLLGHQVLSVKSLPEGGTVLAVQRCC